MAMKCESCGMPMSSNQDHGAQNPDNPYCVHCTDLDGKLLPFERKLEDLVGLAMKNRWMSREVAEKVVRTEMSQMPAWKDKVHQALRP